MCEGYCRNRRKTQASRRPTSSYWTGYCVGRRPKRTGWLMSLTGHLSRWRNHSHSWLIKISLHKKNVTLNSKGPGSRQHPRRPRNHTGFGELVSGKFYYKMGGNTGLSHGICRGAQAFMPGEHIYYNEKRKKIRPRARQRQGHDGMDNGCRTRWRKEAVECLPDRRLQGFHYRCRREGITATYKTTAIRQTNKKGWLGDLHLFEEIGKIIALGGSNRALFDYNNTRLNIDGYGSTRLEDGATCSHKKARRRNFVLFFSFLFDPKTRSIDFGGDYSAWKEAVTYDIEKDSRLDVVS